MPFAFLTDAAKSNIKLCGILRDESLEYLTPFKPGPMRTSGAFAIVFNKTLFAPE